MVVNAPMKSGSALPERSRTSLETITETMLPTGRFALASKEVITRVRLSCDSESVAGTMPPLAKSATLPALTVAGFNDSLKVNTTCEIGATSTVPSLGTIEMMWGAVASPAAPVVNDRPTALSVLPARSLVPLTNTAMLLLPGKGSSEVNRTSLPLTASVPAISPLMPLAVT